MQLQDSAPAGWISPGIGIPVGTDVISDSTKVLNWLLCAPRPRRTRSAQWFDCSRRPACGSAVRTSRRRHVLDRWLMAMSSTGGQWQWRLAAAPACRGGASQGITSQVAYNARHDTWPWHSTPRAVQQLLQYLMNKGTLRTTCRCAGVRPVKTLSWPRCTMRQLHRW